MKLKLVAQNDEIRLSEELKAQLSRKLYKKFKSQNGSVLVNGCKIRTFDFIRKGDIIDITIDLDRESDWPKASSKADIRYESDYYLVLYKEKNLLSIPTKSNPDSLFQQAYDYLEDKGSERTVSILNRLDFETRGLVVVAKDQYSASLLQPTHEKMERRYYAVCHGIFDEKIGTINLPIRRSDDSNKRIISDDGQIAITHYRVLKEENNNSLVEFKLETGRTHQIRLHTSTIGHPILGDKMYGIADGYDDLLLASVMVKFNDLSKNEEITLWIDNPFNDIIAL